MSCVRCDWHRQGGNFVCVWPWGEWNVNAAEEIVARQKREGRARLVTIKWETLRRYAQRDNWLDPANFHAPHLDHVDTSKPGIMGTTNDVPGRRRFLLEGQHRAIQCLRTRRDFSFYLLSEEETDSITIRKARVRSAPRMAARRARENGRGRQASPRPIKSRIQSSS